jgi:hypothetical protein
MILCGQGLGSMKKVDDNISFPIPLVAELERSVLLLKHGGILAIPQSACGTEICDTYGLILAPFSKCPFDFLFPLKGIRRQVEARKILLVVV